MTLLLSYLLIILIHNKGGVKKISEKTFFDLIGVHNERDLF